MGNERVLALPPYPSESARKSLYPSQVSALYNTIASTLALNLSLPPEKRDTPSTRRFLSTFLQDTALQTLNNIIWGSQDDSSSKDQELIRHRSLLLAEKLAISKEGIDCQTLIDLAIVYAPSRLTRVRSVFSSAFDSTPSLAKSVENDVLPAFTHLLLNQHSQGLYIFRKTAYCIISFLRSAPQNIKLLFAHKPFIIALANAYDQGLATIAHSYGGLAVLRNAGTQTREADEWEKIWVETKVALMDTFHIIVSSLLQSLSSASGRALGEKSEQAFDIVFTLLDIPSSFDSDLPPTPFLNRPLLADYQQSYSLSRTLAGTLKHAQEKDARLDLLESSLQALDGADHTTGKKDAGVLKILLRSSGVQPGIDSRGNRATSTDVLGTDSGRSKGKGKEKAPTPPIDLDLDIKVTQVLDILPDFSPQYVRLLLSHPNYNGDSESVIAALLEGTAPDEEELSRTTTTVKDDDDNEVAHLDEVDLYMKERKNVFDDEIMDLDNLRFGKKDGSEILKDRTFIEQMKADILRRVEAMSDDDDEEEEDVDADSGTTHIKRKQIADKDDDIDSDLESLARIKVAGDGEEINDDDDDEEEEISEKQRPETILELAYIKDPKLFERDALTRRSKGRAELKDLSGWDDSQIEGWRIMLERNPRKDKILEKHEFRGNQNPIPEVRAASNPERGRGRGRGGRGGRGGGSRGRGGGGEGGEGSARERTWKDKHKASSANHNRKRGHDKKMQRAGAGPST